MAGPVILIFRGIFCACSDQTVSDGGISDLTDPESRQDPASGRKLQIDMKVAWELVNEKSAVDDTVRYDFFSDFCGCICS